METKSLDNRMIYLEADEISEHDLELIHEYMRKVLFSHNEYFNIRSIPMSDFDGLERFIKDIGTE